MIHTPGVYVDRIIRTDAEKRIEVRTTRKRTTAAAFGAGEEV
jgi:3-oxoacid CoA-transferase subunit A